MASKRKTRASAPPKPHRAETASPARIAIPADTLPRRTLRDAVAVAKAIHSNYAGKSATWDQIASALGIGSKTASTKYLIWSAQAYGIVNKLESSEISLSETGRKIVAPTYQNEDQEGLIKAVLTPALLSKFYTDYNGFTLPAENHFQNVLETKYEIPRDRAPEAIGIIIDNGNYAGILEKQEDSEQYKVKLAGTPASHSSPTTPPVEQPAEAALSEGAVEETEWSTICFYITPIGEDGTEVRRHADMMLKHLVEPALASTGLKVIRADKIERTGLITQQILQHLVHSRLCIVDLSFNNPNVFYELGVRHTCKLPTIPLVRKGDKIPFDVAQGRTITVDTGDVYSIMDRFESAKRELLEHVQGILKPSSDTDSEANPLAIYLPALKVSIK